MTSVPTNLVRIPRRELYAGYLRNPETGDRYYKTKKGKLKKVERVMPLAERRRRMIKPKDTTRRQQIEKLIVRYRKKTASALAQLERDLLRL